MADLAPLRRRITEHSVARCRRAADIAVDQTRAAASRRSGDLVNSISHSEPASTSAGLVTCTITAAAPYSRAQDEGTGLYGPKRTRIFPTHAKVLRFDSPAAGGIVYARSVAGSPGRHFFHEPMPQRWREALRAA